MRYCNFSVEMFMRFIIILFAQIYNLRLRNMSHNKVNTVIWKWGPRDWSCWITRIDALYVEVYITENLIWHELIGSARLRQTSAVGQCSFITDVQDFGKDPFYKRLAYRFLVDYQLWFTQIQILSLEANPLHLFVIAIFSIAFSCWYCYSDIRQCSTEEEI